MSAPLRHARNVYYYLFKKSFKKDRTPFLFHNNRIQSEQAKRLKQSDIKELLKRKETGENYMIQGWVKSIREHKNVTFIHLSDGTCHTPLQVVADSSLVASGLSFGSCISVSGDLVPSSFPAQPIELQATQVHVIGKCDPFEYPFKLKKHHPADYIRQYPHLRPRTNSFASMLRVRHAAYKAVNQYFQDRNFLHVQTPIISSNDCEGAGEIFQVEPSNEKPDNECNGENGNINPHFFNVPAFLTVSGQMHLEVVTGAIKKAYTTNPAFRAENSRGRHHLSEFCMIEAEMAFIHTVEDIIEIVESLIKETTRVVLRDAGDDIDFHLKYIAPKGQESIINNLVEKEYIRISYSEAINLLQRSGKKFQTEPECGLDLQKEHERHLVTSFGNIPVFVTDYPADIKPFYMLQNTGTNTVAAVDLLAPDVGEICGGSLREHEFTILKEKLEKLNLVNEYSWYLDLRKYGTVPHGGFGLGFERYLQVLLGILNIKDTIPFPRSTHNCKM